jgi:hypothetical protein
MLKKHFQRRGEEGIKSPAEMRGFFVIFAL